MGPAAAACVRSCHCACFSHLLSWLFPCPFATTGLASCAGMPSLLPLRCCNISVHCFAFRVSLSHVEGLCVAARRMLAPPCAYPVAHCHVGDRPCTQALRQKSLFCPMPLRHACTMLCVWRGTMSIQKPLPYLHAQSGGRLGTMAPCRCIWADFGLTGVLLASECFVEVDISVRYDRPRMLNAPRCIGSG